MEPSDESLVLACRSDDATAWEQLVDRYQGLVFSIARHAFSSRSGIGGML